MSRLKSAILVCLLMMTFSLTNGYATGVVITPLQKPPKMTGTDGDLLVQGAHQLSFSPQPKVSNRNASLKQSYPCSLLVSMNCRRRFLPDAMFGSAKKQNGADLLRGYLQESQPTCPTVSTNSPTTFMA